MAITSVKIGTLEVNDGVSYLVATNTHYALVAAVSQQARLVEMAGRAPAYAGTTPQARQIPLLIMLLATSVSQRTVDYDALVTEMTNAAGLLPLEWTDSGTTRRYWVHVESVAPDAWFSRAAASLTAPSPYSEVVI
jgi:hypothetical protein